MILNRERKVDRCAEGRQIKEKNMAAELQQKIQENKKFLKK